MNTKHSSNLCRLQCRGSSVGRRGKKGEGKRRGGHVGGEGVRGERPKYRRYFVLLPTPWLCILLPLLYHLPMSPSLHYCTSLHSSQSHLAFFFSLSLFVFYVPTLSYHLPLDFSPHAGICVSPASHCPTCTCLQPLSHFLCIVYNLLPMLSSVVVAALDMDVVYCTRGVFCQTLCCGSLTLCVYVVGIKGLYPLSGTDFAPFTKLPLYVEIK